MDTWIELRAGGKIHGRFDPVRLVLEVRQQDRVFVYDLAATAQVGRSVVEWSLIPERGLKIENICAMIEA